MIVLSDLERPLTPALSPDGGEGRREIGGFSRLGFNFSMTDYFALLNEPRRPWLDPEPLKDKFLALSATVHPDRVHNLGAAERAAAQERYTELNAA